MNSMSATAKNENTVVVNVSSCRYEVIYRVVKSLGWALTRSDQIIWDIYWSDGSRGINELIRNSKHFQRMNHFPGMNEIYSKSTLAKTLQKMKTVNKESYTFYPTTWELPQAYAEVVKYLTSKRSQSDFQTCLILKPKSGAKGEGIFLCRNMNSIPKDFEYMVCCLIILFALSILIYYLILLSYCYLYWLRP